jgi:hypothetical protein
MGEAPWLLAPQLQLSGWIRDSHQRAWGLPLRAGLANCTLQQAAQELFAANTVLLAHDNSADPRLIYANAAALRLWRRPWAAMVGLPSRLTAQPTERQARAQALAVAQAQSKFANYGGIRIDSHGRRFRIEGARLWTLTDDAGKARGQVACFENWWWL